VVEVFVDESGIHEGAPICLVAGYRGTKRQWNRFRHLWIADGCQVELHARRFFARTPEGKRVSPYADWSDEKAEGFLASRLHAIKSAHLNVVGAMIDVRAFRLLTHDERRQLTGGHRLYGKWNFSGAPTKPYYLVFQHLVIQAIENIHNLSWKADFVFDQQNQLAPLAARLYSRMKASGTEYPVFSRMGDVIFSSRLERPGLQAADLLAHCWYQYVFHGKQTKPEIRRVMNSLTQRSDEMPFFSRETMFKLVGRLPLTDGRVLTH